jgi:replicative DNA helicase
VVYCTLEQTVEELSTFHVAAESKISITRMATGRVSDEQWNDITGVLAHRMTSPLWFVGYGGERRTKQRLDMAAIENGLDEIAEWDGDGGFVLDCVFLDYLQRIPYEGESKVIGISNNLDEIARYAKSRGVPFVCGVQAVRDVDKRDDPTPLLDDGQWTSNIEQASDKCASLVRPCQYKGQGEAFGGVAVEGYSQMVISFLKQKLGRANWRKWLNLDPRYNDLAAAELKNALPDDHKDY